VYNGTRGGLIGIPLTQINDIMARVAGRLRLLNQAGKDLLG
jgi:hypothetical protein